MILTNEHTVCIFGSTRINKPNNTTNHLQNNNKQSTTHRNKIQRLGEVEESEKIMESLRRGESNLSCLVDSWGYTRWHTRRTNPYHLNLHRGTRAMIQIALEAAQPLLQHDDGLVCEFGVASGHSMRMTQELLRATIAHVPRTTHRVAKTSVMGGSF